jgi:hypothetical protein
MQIYKVAPDRVPARRSLACCGLHGGQYLGAGPTSANPYPNGIPVSGQGPLGQPFAVDWSPVMNTWVSHSPFGAFPLWNDQNFGQVQQALACQAPFNSKYADYNDGSMTFSDALGYYDQANQYGGDICRAPLDFFQTQLGRSGQVTLITGGPPCGTGTQTAFYAFDSSTGWYKPVSVQGSNNCPDISMLASFGIFVGLATAVIGGAAALAPAAGAEAGASAAIAAPAAATVDAGAAVGTVAPEIASFTVPEIAAPAVLDISASVPIDVAGIATQAAGASTIGQVFNVLNYVKQLAGAYSTIKSISQLTGGFATHPQAGAVSYLPDGSRQIINPNGTISIMQPGGTVTTVGPGGTITPGFVAPPQVSQAGFGGVGTVVMGLSLLGYLLTR